MICQCIQTHSVSIIITNVDLFYVDCVTSHPLDGVHFQDALEHLHLTTDILSCIHS